MLEMLFKFSSCLSSSKEFLVPKIFKSQFLKSTFCSVVTEEKLKKINYFLVLDFEATCDKSKKYEQEIIEFPCLKLNARTLAEEGRFHRFVRPTLNPILTEFCIELTGILQEIVDNEETFPEVFQAFEEWRERENLTDENSLYITSGDWDFGHMLPVQCNLCDLEIPSHMKVWADIKKLFADHTGVYKNTLVDIMRYYNLQHVGRLHSGLDDAINVGNIVRCLIHTKGVIYPTSKLYYSDQKRKVERIKMIPNDPLKHLFVNSEYKI